MGARKWEDKHGSPDWTDIFVMMKALEALHEVVVTIAFTCAAYDGPSGFITFGVYHVPEAASVLGQPVMALSGEWPCKNHRDVESCVYAGLYDLDGHLSEKLWKQLKLPFTPE